MTIVISLNINERSQVAGVSAVRIDNNWIVRSVYSAEIDGENHYEKSAVTDAMLPLIKMVHKTDLIVFGSQHACDMFVGLTKSYATFNLSRRCAIIPFGLETATCSVSNLENMIRKLRTSGMTVSAWLRTR